MPQPLMVGMTQDIYIGGGYTIRINAVSATTGAVVAGVNVSAAALLASDVGPGEPVTPDAPAPLLVPANSEAV